MVLDHLKQESIEPYKMFWERSRKERFFKLHNLIGMEPLSRFFARAISVKSGILPSQLGSIPNKLLLLKSIAHKSINSPVMFLKNYCLTSLKFLRIPNYHKKKELHLESHFLKLLITPFLEKLKQS